MTPIQRSHIWGGVSLKGENDHENEIGSGAFCSLRPYHDRKRSTIFRQIHTAVRGSLGQDSTSGRRLLDQDRLCRLESVCLLGKRKDANDRGYPHSARQLER